MLVRWGAEGAKGCDGGMGEQWRLIERDLGFTACQRAAVGWVEAAVSQRRSVKRRRGRSAGGVCRDGQGTCQSLRLLAVMQMAKGAGERGAAAWRVQPARIARNGSNNARPPTTPPCALFKGVEKGERGEQRPRHVVCTLTQGRQAGLLAGRGVRWVRRVGKKKGQWKAYWWPQRTDRERNTHAR